jgi:hypothetical protein
MIEELHMDDGSLKQQKLDTTPSPRIHYEKIGDTEWPLPELTLDVIEDVRLWDNNPRILPFISTEDVASESDLEVALQRTPGYDTLRRSIEDIGQMEPIYVWKGEHSDKYIVYEGATRVSILRDLSRKHANGPKAHRYARVKVKVLPPHFGEAERVILLARIHVRGSGVRGWGRYIEAKFIWDHVSDSKDHKALMSVSQLATWMGKSTAWVQRLRDAYQFARRFVEYVDRPDGEKLAVDEFSTLEEISKVAVLGPKLREYDNKEFDTLRAEVFDMVRNCAFKEYREARFLKEFHEDPEKWALLKSGEKHVATRLASEVKASGSGAKAKIGSIEQSVERALERQDHGLGEEEIGHLRRAMKRIEEQQHPGVRPFLLGLKGVTRTLSEASMADVKALPATQLAEFNEALEYFNDLVRKHHATVA